LVTKIQGLSEFMNIDRSYQFSGPVTTFQEKYLPEPVIPAGYAALIDALKIKVPLPRTLTAIGEKHRIIEYEGWRFLTPRHTPEATIADHLAFALKYEGLDLAVLKRVFLATGPVPIEAMVQAAPTGSYARRIWFLYEWLTAQQLDLPNATQGAFVPVVNEKQQWAVPGQLAQRQRVKVNLPGTPEFCPLAFRTPALEQGVAMDLPQQARQAIAEVSRDVLARAAAFLLLEDSKTSYAIEGESAPQNRIQRWGRVIGEAGKHNLDLEELLRLQRLVIGDARFVNLGLRQEGGFVGSHDRDRHLPLPVHISARAEDLTSLMDGMINFAKDGAQGLDAVIAATSLAFGFVYTHPFDDGNGRIHRYLIHHVLAQREFNPPGVTFPVSAAILRNIDRYREVLEDYSRRLLPVIKWEPTAQGNILVNNDTADFYRFLDITPHAEFLYDCVRQTIEEDLPFETRLLRRFDAFREQAQDLIDMPDRTIDLLFKFLRQNDGKLSRRARQQEFAQLTDGEVSQVEGYYDNIFG
jgi:Fic family protein